DRQPGTRPLITFEWPWVFFALPVPLIVHLLAPPANVSQQSALRVPSLSPFQALGGSATGVSTLRSWPLLIAAFAWVLLVGATARPIWQGAPISLPVSGRDLMMAVDISGSMQNRDFRLGGRMVDRLTATKAVAAEFITRREGDRLGLVLFGRQAYLQTPLTFDRDTVKTLLLEAEVGFAGKETAIGDAIGLSLKRLRRDAGDDRVLILLTDGANTAGELDPLKAAELAASEELRIYTIGIGAAGRSSPFTLRMLPGSELDESTLRSIAETTGGQYFRAHDTGELMRIYAYLDELEKVEQDVGGFRPRHALYAWPLAGALGLSGLLTWLRLRAS
ncbi:MAG: VWA domain-containing protein, partial [Pseudomonadota bacterium]